MAIRTGEVPFEQTIAEIEAIERRLEAAVAESALPKLPDYARVDEFVIDTYRDAWGWR
jgi:hypothetical protein